MCFLAVEETDRGANPQRVDRVVVGVSARRGIASVAGEEGEAPRAHAEMRSRSAAKSTLRRWDDSPATEAVRPARSHSHHMSGTLVRPGPGAAAEYGDHGLGAPLGERQSAVQQGCVGDASHDVDWAA